MPHHLSVGLPSKAALKRYLKAGYHVGTFSTGKDRPVKSGKLSVCRPPASTVRSKAWKATVQVKNYQVVSVS